ncbi:MAG: protease inhibitor I42 family protein [Actinomycetota bacterium]
MGKKFLIVVFLTSIIIFSMTSCLNKGKPEPKEKDIVEETQKEEFKSGIPELDTEEKCITAAQEEIEKNPMYEEVVFKNPFSSESISKVKGKQNLYECIIKFEAWNKEKEKQGHFVWVFIVEYKPDADECVIHSSKKEVENYKPEEKVLTEKNNGESLNLEINDIVKIKLESNPSTGYSWVMSDKVDSTVISVTNTEYIESEESEEKLGAGGYEIFTLKSISKGKTPVILNYERSWEQAKPEKIFKVTISVD